MTAAARGTCATVGAALSHARTLGLDRLDAQLLLARAVQHARAWLMAHEEAALSDAQQARFASECRRRAEGEPLAYLLGEREFHGLMLRITPDVLVPRPDTETLVDWAIEVLTGPFAAEAAPRVADLGTGSGAIALALKHSHPGADVCALDLNAAAVELARANAAAHRPRDRVHGGRLVVAAGRPALPSRAQQSAVCGAGRPASSGVAARALAGACRLAATAWRHWSTSCATRRNTCCRAAGCCWSMAMSRPRPLAMRWRSAGFTSVLTRTDLAGRPRCTGGRLGPA